MPVTLGLFPRPTSKHSDLKINIIMKQKFTLILFTLFFSTQLIAQSETALELESFSAINIASHGHVYLTQGEPQRVVMKSVKNEDQVMVQVKNGVLLINAKAGDEILVTTPEVNKIAIGGSGVVEGASTISTDELKLDISGDGKIVLDINTKNVEVGISGLGKVVLSGNTVESKFNISGSGKVDAINLKASKCHANISGLGKCTIDVTDELVSNISGSGSVNYKTKPNSVVENTTGVGKITEYHDGYNGDTTRFSFGSRDLLIIEKDDAVRLAKKSEPRPVWSGIEFGINSYLNKDGNFDIPTGYDGLELRQEKSIAISLNLLQKNFEIAKSNLWFFTGLGITWNNYRFDNNISLLSTNPLTFVRDTTSGFKYEKSKLVVSYLTAPIMFEYFTGRNKKKTFHIGAGAMLGLRIGSHTKQKYEDDGKTYKPKTYDDFNLNPFRYGFRVAVGYGGFNLFADYYASTLFKDKKGPSLYPVSVGITLVDF